MHKQTVILVVLDGWGIGAHDFTNPIYLVNPPNFNYIKHNFPIGALQASGISVGLPWGEEGNSEVGHLNMGAGRIIYQNYPRITLAIRNGQFFQNETIKRAFDHAKEKNSSVNLIGLLTEANVHASFEHLKALIDFADKENFPKEKLNLHLITDGRDSEPESAMKLIEKLPYREQVASLAGRYYTMDRAKNWTRVQEGYNAMIGNGPAISDIQKHLQETYDKGLNDEYIVPALVNPKRPISDNDSVIFFNFREDRMKQIVRAFIQKDFKEFPTKKFNNLFIASMISYDDAFDIPNVFPPEEIDTPLGKVLSDSGKIQFRVAETEKYAHVTYFFNGLKEDPYPNEYRVLIPSQTGQHDEHPEMRAREICSRMVQAIEEKTYDFILANFANADMVAHTGNFKATEEAIRILDEQIGILMKTVLENDAVMLITADHGNAEKLIEPLTGEIETKHDASPVPIYLIGNKYKTENSDGEIHAAERAPMGVLADVSPTVLELMNLPKPVEMTAQNLLDLLI